MKRNQLIIVALVYIFALLLSSLFGFPYPNFSWSVLTLPILIYGILALIASLIIPRFWRTGPGSLFWLILPLFAIFASIFLQFRTPQPSVNDISQFVGELRGNSVSVTGTIINNPSLNSQNNVRFFLKVNQVKDINKNVSGKLYITLPLLQATGLSSGQNITVSGRLYEPSTNPNPGGFDFKKYLAQQGVFAGLKGEIVNEYGFKKWGFWKIRQRIVKAQVKFLSSPVGPLVSSIILGRSVVDLPIDVQDSFIKAGLAHVLAASGFHVALLLGVLLFIIQGLSGRNKLIIGSIVLIFYVVLTGFQPSILRASIMGFGALIGLVTDRKIRRLSFLILTAFILLLINPLWIFDLSFQLSFSATLGLIITVEPIVNKLDFLPVNIANLIAIPLAANIWCLPLSIYIFKFISLYAILVNVVVTPLVVAISLIGMFSALVSLIFPLLGSVIAVINYYPTAILMEIVNFFVELPYSYLAIAQISLLQLTIIYLVIISIWLNHFLAQRWFLLTIFVFSLITIPVVYTNLTLTKITILASHNEPIIVVQASGKSALIYTDNKNNEKYIIKPFLAQQGINNLDVTINLNNLDQSNFVLNKDVNISIFNNYLELTIKDNKWWLFDKNISTNDFPTTKNKSPDVLLWSGNKELDGLNLKETKKAIALTNYLSDHLKQQLTQANIELYITGEDGAIQWTEKHGFTPLLAQSPNL